MTQTSTLAPPAESISQRLSVLEQQVGDLQADVARLKSSHNGGPVYRLSLDEAAIEQARRLAAEMFGGNVEVELESDPADPSYEFIVFGVECRGEPKELIQRQLEWHDRVEQATNGVGRGYRLVLYPVE